MSPLSTRAQAIVGAGRDGLRPSLTERERIEALLDARLSAGAGAGTATATSKGLGAMKAWQLALGLTLATGAAIVALRSGETSPPPAAAPAAAPVVSVATSTSAHAPLPEPPAAASSEPAPEAERAVTAPRAEKDQLAQEVALLSRATSALRAGRASEALKALDEHQRKFPTGVLAVESRAARAQALCTLKRVSEGRAELARLAPGSPAAARTKQLCDSVAAQDSGR